MTTETTPPADLFDRLTEAMPKMAEAVNAFTLKDNQRLALQALLTAVGVPAGLTATPVAPAPLSVVPPLRKEHDEDTAKATPHPVADGDNPKRPRPRKAKNAEQSIQPPQPPSEGGDQQTPSDDASSMIDENAVFAAVSEHTGVSTDKLEQVFHIEDDGTVKVLVNHTALGTNAANKTRVAAQIITVVRKIGMGQTDTSFDAIRNECVRKHFYDPKHFANTHLPSISGFVVKGEGRGKRLEARNAGISAFPALIEKVLSES